MKQKFGGPWTEKKLDCIEKYLKAYVKILSKTPYRYAYIDAFAGTGYREIKDEDNNQILIPELIEDEPQSFMMGSVIRALEIKPRFNKYIFIENDKDKYLQLTKILEDYSNFEKDIQIINSEANEYLIDLCRYDWNKHRAVLFLDPFGMQVKWSTIESIAKTKAIDTWILFPLGIGVSRLLKKDGEIRKIMKNKLDNIFGNKDWFSDFYHISLDHTLFGDEKKYEKIIDFDGISQYFINRLKSIFAEVSNYPAKLVNSKNNPLFLLCFAASNEIGASTAVKIADYLLRKI